jgi:hypothetical protein
VSWLIRSSVFEFLSPSRRAFVPSLCLREVLGETLGASAGLCVVSHSAHQGGAPLSPRFGCVVEFVSLASGCAELSLLARCACGISLMHTRTQRDFSREAMPGVGVCWLLIYLGAATVGAIVSHGQSAEVGVGGQASRPGNGAARRKSGLCGWKGSCYER